MLVCSAASCTDALRSNTIKSVQQLNSESIECSEDDSESSRAVTTGADGSKTTAAELRHYGGSVESAAIEVAPLFCQLIANPRVQNSVLSCQKSGWLGCVCSSTPACFHVWICDQPARDLDFVKQLDICFLQKVFVRSDLYL